MNFTKYPHLEKYGNAEVEDINIGQSWVFPKLDGTNASAWIDNEGNLAGGSRNRSLSEHSDNAGFFNWLTKDESAINYRRLLFAYADWRLFGEWLVPHTVKHYRDDAWRKFYIFDVYDESKGRFLTYDEYKPVLDSYAITYIPCVAKITNGLFEQYLRVAKENKYLLINPETTEKMGEGVVIKNYEWRNKYGRQTWAKIVNGEFKDDFYAKMGADVIVDNYTGAQALAELACTEALIEKEYAKIVNADGGWSSKSIPRLLDTVYHCVVTEELWDSLKKIKSPVINFRELKQHCIIKVKQTKPELF